MELYLFAILPFSLLWWPKQRRGIVGIIPLLAALVPAAISGVRALVNRRQAGDAASRAPPQAQGFEPNTTAIPNAPDPSGGRLGVAQDIMTGLESFDTGAYNRARNPTPPRRF